MQGRMMKLIDQCGIKIRHMSLLIQILNVSQMTAGHSMIHRKVYVSDIILSLKDCGLQDIKQAQQAARQEDCANTHPILLLL